MRLRWNLVVILCLTGMLALGASLASPASPSSLAMQDGSPTPPSEAASTFCPTPFAMDDESMIEPEDPTMGVVLVPNIDNPYVPNDAADSAKMRLSLVTLPAGTCMLGSHFYPGAIVTVLSGDVEMLVEHWPGIEVAPVATLLRSGLAASEPVDTSAPFAIHTDDWLQIQNESFVGFKNDGGSPAEFVVAGLKPDGDPVGGGGVHRGRP
jgi:hypothetical protein